MGSYTEELLLDPQEKNEECGHDCFSASLTAKRPPKNQL